MGAIESAAPRIEWQIWPEQQQTEIRARKEGAFETSSAAADAI